MKNYHYYLIALATAAALQTSACTPPQNQAELDNNTSKATSIPGPGSDHQSITPPDSITKEEWNEFKKTSEKTIAQNEVIIDDIKSKMKDSGKSMDSVYTKMINNLEKSNKDMKTKISDYEKNKGNWETFKREFNNDMDALGKALKNLVVDNKN